MEYKKDDTVKLLKDYETSDNVFLIGMLVRVYNDKGKTVIIEIPNVPGISCEIDKKDVELIERIGYEPGICPFCEKEGNLDYGTLEIIDEQIMYPWGCPDCGGSGEEWYRMEFIDMIGKKLE